MDAGLAAVLGAVAGSVGGIAGSIVTGRVQRDGVLMSVRAEHLKERRQPRHDAYKVFLRSMTDLKDRVLVESYQSTSPQEEVAFRKEINERWIELSLYGPPVVSATDGVLVRERARAVVDAMAAARQREYELLNLPDDYTPEILQEAEDVAGRAVDYVQSSARTLAKAIDDFALAASDALNDDGTKRLRQRRIRFFARRRLYRQHLAELRSRPAPDRSPGFR
ncbi:hypothetical protein ABTY98_09805 [Streptomyces sp. NPDC096040]|uniref:hypothetical protein n=1 Tax=Streptomyces sp. NPDC096040 TaxID=3155541 RepID=UPI0033208217